MQLLDYIVLAAYFLTVIGIGLWSMNRIKGQEDYFMGGRGFGKLLQTFAAFGAGTGAHEPVAVGRTVWTSGLSGVWSALMWLFVTPVYWITAVWYRRMRHLTLGDWFVERYQSKGLGAAYSVFAITFYMWYLSSMLSAIAKIAIPLLGVESIAGLDVEFVLVPLLALIVILYGVLGGLTAAYYTDLIQGIFIILLSVLLIPFGLLALVKAFGEGTDTGVMDGFRLLHERVPEDYFSLFAGPASGEFPVQYIVALSVLALVGVVVQPHFIATGGGSAKSEDEARIGLVVGNFLKRMCTVGWAITAVIALALLAGDVDIATDPDRVWGEAAREILGPLNLGLVGLMLACLLAAMMSSADAYMIVTSGLITRNVYAAYINSDGDERTYLAVGRLTGLTIIIGASLVALSQSDVFGQFKFAVELPIVFAAPFWLGMFWRRTNRVAVWCTVMFSLTFFFILPMLLPQILPSLRNDPRFSQKTDRVTVTTTRNATAADVAKYEAWTEARAQAQAEGDSAVIEKLGAAPPQAALGEPIQVTTNNGNVAIFWSGGLKSGENNDFETLSDTESDNQRTIVSRETGEFSGQGSIKLDLLVYSLAGYDLSGVSKATLETLRLPTRVVLPFVVLMVLSLVTPRDKEGPLNRYFVKMKIVVDPDHERDQANLDAAYADPSSVEHAKLFPGTDWEFGKPRFMDVAGFLVSIAVCGLVISMLAWLASLGA